MEIHFWSRVSYYFTIPLHEVYAWQMEDVTFCVNSIFQSLHYFALPSL